MELLWFVLPFMLLGLATEKEEGDKRTDTESEDDDSSETSEEDESFEESDDDSSEEDSEESKDSGDKESDEDKKIAAQQFLDPKSIPKELMPAWKKMQSTFTRKSQILSTGIKKAEAFDVLIGDPGFRAFMEARKTGTKFVMNAGKNKKDDDDSDEDDDKPLTKKDLKAILNAERQGTNLAQQEETIRKEAEQFKKEHTNWELHKDSLMEILGNNPTLSYEDAYVLATKEERNLLDKKTSSESKKSQNSKKPNRTQGKEGQKKGKGMTVNDAFEMAKRTLGMK